MKDSVDLHAEFIGAKANFEWATNEIANHRRKIEELKQFRERETRKKDAAQYLIAELQPMDNQ